MHYQNFPFYKALSPTMHSHNMVAVTLSQYKSKKDSTRQQLSHCVRICVSSFFRLRERYDTELSLNNDLFLPSKYSKMRVGFGLPLPTPNKAWATSVADNE